MGTNSALERHLGAHPDVLQHLDRIRSAANGVCDPAVLNLCQQRIRELLGVATTTQLSGWPNDQSLSPAAKACLAFTEEFVIDVASLSDITAATVRYELGEQAMIDFVAALLVVEQRERIALTLETVFGPES